MYYEVVPEGKIGILTYNFDASLVPGQMVMVPVGRRTVPGVVIKKVAQPEFKTREILKVLYAKPLPKHLLDVVRFMHEYYLVAEGEAVGLILPRGVQKQRRKIKTEQMFGVDDEATESIFSNHLMLQKNQIQSLDNHKPNIPLNPHQKKALEGLSEARSATKLLFGVTGSGKTNIYVKMAARTLSGQKSVILLVPEIALTGQLVQVFRGYFGERVIVMHSRQIEAERHRIFDSLLMADEPKIVIGPRSALFAPLSNLGLIIIDEAHESTYTQENAPRYSALRVASFMAQDLGIDCVLGSATPTVEDFYLANRQGAVVKLTEKAKAAAIKPEVRIIDLKNRDNFRKNRYFCDNLIAKMQENIEQGRQTLIFHNRRGSSTLTICEKCGEEILCPNCFLPLTLHADNYELVCHTCGFAEKVPSVCPKCGTPGMVHRGFGTKLLEAEARKLFPRARIRRFDADNKKGEGLAEIYSEVRDGEVDILIGTQTLAKGLDLPRLATVGVVQADAGLSLPDYMAEERVFQLLTQVMGRVGRGHLTEAEVLVQTYRPEHPILKFASDEDYLGFYEYLIRRRQKSGFPPFKFVMKLEITLKTEVLVLKKVRETAQRLARNARLIVSPPQPAFHERTNRGYTWQIVVRARSRKALIEACSDLDKKFRITLDPPGLL
ncbi:primosomal protein N' [Candidatus Saccharibacteria bacterium]|nr:primosomal protein N' [Candidatus Saccharibacteria bacterium]